MIKKTTTTVILLLGLSVMLWGKPLILTPNRATYDLKEYLETLRAGGLTYPEVVQAASEGRFRPLEEEAERLPYQEYWIKLELDNRYTYEEGIVEWMLHFSPILSLVEVYFTDLDQSVKSRKSGLFTPVSERIFKSALRENLVKVPLQVGQSSTLFIRVRSDRKGTPPEFKARLMPAETYLKAFKSERQHNGFFTGFIWMMTILSLVFFFQTWGRVYIYYSLYLIAVSGYASYVEGDLADWVVPGFFPNNPQYIFFFKLITYLAIISYTCFLRSFLDLKQLLPKWDRILHFFIWLAVPLILLDAILIVQSNYSSIVPDQVTLSYILGFSVFSLFFLWSLYKTGDKKGRFILVGVAAMSIGFILNVIERLRNPEFSLIFLEIGSIIEILAFTLGLAYRQRLNERARLKARYELEKSQFLQQQEQAETERLRELDEFKNRFYTNITHEFRTPLTVIMGMAEEIGDSKIKRLITRNSKNLFRLINQILDLSKLDSGKLKLKLIQADIISFLQYLTESFLSSAESKHIRLSFYPEISHLKMDFDEEKIQQIIYNLLSNAIKFTPKYGKIIFHAREIQTKSGTSLQLKIQDSGPGIPEDHLPYIFDRFYQVENAENPGKGGTGIGLALTKELVELMGGTIRVSSEEDQGSLFTVLLPIRTEQSLNTGEWKEVKAPLSAEQKVSSKAGANSIIERPLLLIIEDNADVIEYVELFLEKTYEIHSARNGAEGIEMALELIPDIIISDIMMPEKNGYEVCEYLKNDTRTNHVPIILLTAKTAKEEQLKGLRLGADAFLTKPFHKEELLIRLEKLVELRKNLQSHYLQGTPSTSALTKEELFIQQLHQIIEQKIDDADLSVTHLCRAVQLSHAHLYRKLKALTNQTPVQFIRFIRLKKARELLENTNLNVSEVAFSVGFTDPNYFSRIFHKEIGFTPSEFRK